MIGLGWGVVVVVVGVGWWGCFDVVVVAAGVVVRVVDVVVVGFGVDFV